MEYPALFTWRAGLDGVRAPSAGSRARARHAELTRKLEALQKDHSALQAAMFEAAQVHRHLCAPRVVQNEDFEIASEVFAVRYLSGDFFTVENTQAGTVLALGDVCGKGLAAGMWTPCVVGLLRAHAACSPAPTDIVTGVNREFCRMHAPLTSVFVARLEPDGSTLRYSSAGHPPALLLRASGAVESLSDGGMLLGMSADATFREGSADLEPGDLLVAYSDGVIESRNDADEEFGCERLEAHLRLAVGASAEEVLFSLLAAVQDFAGLQALADDTSLVVVRRHGRGTSHATVCA